MKVKWKQRLGFDNYLISNTGRVISTTKNRTKELKAQPDAIGYLHFRLYPDEPIFGFYDNNRGKVPKLYKVHRLVLETFLPNADTTLEVNHIDGNKHNNCIDNLEWLTKSENMRHSYDIGLRKNQSSKTAKANRRPLVAIYKDGTERYFAGNIIAKFGLGCSLGTVAKFIKSGEEIQRGSAKGYSLIRLKELPTGHSFEQVPDIENKVREINARWFGAYRVKRNKKKLLK